MNLCVCGCGKLASPGKTYIRGHHGKGRKFSEKTKRKMSESQKGHSHSEETKRKISESNKGKQNFLGHKHSEETKRKISKSGIIHGKQFIYNQHHKHKKEECLFECRSEFYDLHHEPELDYDNILEWEGRLVNLCVSCHMKVHRESLSLLKNSGFMWTKKDTEKALKGIL